MNTRMAGDRLKQANSFSYIDKKDLVQLDDETQVHKDDVAEYLKNNYKRNKSYSGM